MLMGKLKETMVAWFRFRMSFSVTLISWNHSGITPFYLPASLPQVEAFSLLYHWQPAWRCCCLSTSPPIWDPFLYPFSWWCLLQITIIEVHQITGTERHHHSRQAMDTKGTPTPMFILGEGITSGEALFLRATFRMKSGCCTTSPEALLSTGA